MDSKKVKVLLLGDQGVGKTSLVVLFAENRFPSEDCVPTVYDVCSVPTTVDGQIVNLNICDMAGQNDWKRLRQMSYENADVFLLCFSLNCYHSFSNIEKLWLPEAREVCPDSKFILVGTKLDLVDTGENCACQGKQTKKNSGTTTTTSSSPGNAAKMGKMTMTKTMRRMTSRMLDRMRLHAEEWTEEEEEEVRKPTRSDVLNLLKKADGIIESYLECSAKTEKNVRDVFQDAVRVVLSNDKKLKRSRNHNQIVKRKMVGLEHIAERHCVLL